MDNEKTILFMCNPKKNSACRKTACLERGGLCFLTAHEEYKITGSSPVVLDKNGEIKRLSMTGDDVHRLNRAKEVQLMKFIAIDGACYHNGKPDSVACGAFVALDNNADIIVTRGDIKHATFIEEGGTNQRAELHGLIAALEYIRDYPANFLLITDSEYIYNAMTKDWVRNWRANNWLTAAGDPVKNIDLWKRVYELTCEIAMICEDAPCYYHIKGHIISFGTATRQRLIESDPTGFDLMLALINKFDTDLQARKKEVDKAQACSIKNNGFELSSGLLKRFAILNMLADAFASNAIEEYNKQW